MSGNESKSQFAMAISSNENHTKDSNGSMLSMTNGTSGNPVTTLKRDRRRTVSRSKKKRGVSKRSRRGNVSLMRQKGHSGRRSRSKRRLPKGERRRDDEDLPSSFDDEGRESDVTVTSNDDGWAIVSDTNRENGDGCGGMSLRSKKSSCGNKRRRKKSTCESCSHRRKKRSCSWKKSKLRSSRPRTCYDGDITEMASTSDEESNIDMTSATTASSKPKSSRGIRSRHVHHRTHDEDYTDTD